MFALSKVYCTTLRAFYVGMALVPGRTRNRQLETPTIDRGVNGAKHGEQNARTSAQRSPVGTFRLH